MNMNHSSEAVKWEDKLKGEGVGVSGVVRWLGDLSVGAWIGYNFNEMWNETLF